VFDEIVYTSMGLGAVVLLPMLWLGWKVHRLEREFAKPFERDSKD